MMDVAIRAAARPGRRRLVYSCAVLTGGSTSPLLQRDCGLRRLGCVQSIFGGTTEIQKEIIGRGLGL